MHNIHCTDGSCVTLLGLISAENVPAQCSVSTRRSILTQGLEASQSAQTTTRAVSSAQGSSIDSTCYVLCVLPVLTGVIILFSYVVLSSFLSVARVQCKGNHRCVLRRRMYLFRGQRSALPGNKNRYASALFEV